MTGRNLFISLAISAVILLCGRLAFRDSEHAVWAAQVVSFAVGLTLFNVLDNRDGQRKRQAERDD